MRYIKLVLTYVLVLILLFASVMKFSGSSMEIMVFQAVGFGMWFMYFTAALELIAAVLILIKKYRRTGFIVALVVFFGAFLAQVFFIHMDWIHTVVLSAIAAWLAFSRRTPIVESVASVS